MRTTKPQHIYFQSKINKDLIERFEIEESIIGFNHDDFRSRIKEELAYLGMDYSELALKCYINSSRMMSLLTKNVKFLPNEISPIKKLLGM